MTAEEVDQAFQAVLALEEPARAQALALKQAVEGFHRDGLIKIIQTLKADPRGKELLFELVDEPEVKALFLLHGLIRIDPRQRVEQALESCRPYLQSHNGDVELVSLEAGVARVKMKGACNGCSMSAVTLKTHVEEALKGIVERVELVKAEPTTTVGVYRREEYRGPLLSELEHDRPTHHGPYLLVRLEDGLYAYRNECAHQGLPLHEGSYDTATAQLSCPWHGFTFDLRTGECLTAPTCQLEPLRTRLENGRVYVVEKATLEPISS